jgi:hypothetical protein
MGKKFYNIGPWSSSKAGLAAAGNEYYSILLQKSFIFYHGQYYKTFSINSTAWRYAQIL